MQLAKIKLLQEKADLKIKRKNAKLLKAQIRRINAETASIKSKTR